MKVLFFSRKLFFRGGDEKHSQGRGVHLPCTFSQTSSMFDDNKHHVSFYQVMICSRERDFGMIRIYLTERTKWEQNLVTNLKDCAIGETIGSIMNILNYSQINIAYICRFIYAPSLGRCHEKTRLDMYIKVNHWS